MNEWCKKLRKEERGLERQVAQGNYDIMWENANEHKANMPGDCDQEGRSQGHSFSEGGGKERGQGCVQDPGKVWQGYAGFPSLNRFSNVVCIREVVSSRKAVNKIYAAKANLNSVQLQMKGQLAQVVPSAV